MDSPPQEAQQQLLQRFLPGRQWQNPTEDEGLQNEHLSAAALRLPLNPAGLKVSTTWEISSCGPGW